MQAIILISFVQHMNTFCMNKKGACFLNIFQRIMAVILKLKINWDEYFVWDFLEHSILPLNLMNYCHPFSVVNAGEKLWVFSL